MFDASCDRCGAVVLLGPRRIVSLENTDDGIVLSFRCYCGAVGTEVVGRDAPLRVALRRAALRRAAESETAPPARTADGEDMAAVDDEAGGPSR